MIDNINAGDIVSVKPINEIIDTVNGLTGGEQPPYESITSNIYDSAVIMPDKQLADRFKNNWQKTGITSNDIQFAQKSIEIQKVKYELYVDDYEMQTFYANSSQLLNFNDLLNKNSSYITAWEDNHRYDVLVRDIVDNDNEDSEQEKCATLKYVDKNLFGGGTKLPEIFDIEKYMDDDTPMFKIKNCVIRMGRAYDFSFEADTYDIEAQNGILGYCVSISTGGSLSLSVGYYTAAQYGNSSISENYQPLYKTNAVGDIILDYRRLLGIQSYDNTSWGIISGTTTTSGT